MNIVKKCRDLGVGQGGFYRPGYQDGAKLRLHMMCLGLNWDAQTRKYEKHRPFDNREPPPIPHEFSLLVKNSIRDSHSLIKKEFDSNPEEVLPWMNPDICIVNFYTTTGRLGLHQVCFKLPCSRPDKFTFCQALLDILSFSGTTGEMSPIQKYPQKQKTPLSLWRGKPTEMKLLTGLLAFSV